MQHYNLTSKRARLAIRFFTYGVMTVSVLVLSTLLLLFLLGYRLNQDLSFYQGGLVEFDSTPSGATVTVDGKRQRDHTASNASLMAGKHAINMARAGYRPWSNTIDLGPGQLLWLNYIRLVPKTIITRSVHQMSTLADAVASPDRHWLLLQPQPTAANFMLANLSNLDSPTFTDISLPETSLTKTANGSTPLSIVEWDPSSRYVLIKHQLDTDTAEFIRMQLDNPASAVNISTLFGFTIAQVHFSASDANILFASTGGVLRRLDLGNSSSSGALLTGLRQFAVYAGDAVLATSDDPQLPADRSQALSLWQNGSTSLLRSFSAADQVLFAYGQYDSHVQIAYANSTGSQIAILRDPTTAAVKTAGDILTGFDLGASPQWLAFSANGRMLAVQSNQHFAAFDLETARLYQTDLAVAGKIVNPLSWLDTFHLSTVIDGSLHVLDFDGSNPQSIVASLPNRAIALSGDAKQLLSIAKDTTGSFELQASELTTDQ